MTDSKLGKSNTFSKLLNAGHVSTVNSVKHAANALIHQSMKAHHDSEAKNLVLIKEQCLANAEKGQNEATNKCKSEFQQAQKDNTLSNDVTVEYNRCIEGALSQYNISSTECLEALVNTYDVLGVELGAIGNSVFLI